MSYGPARLRKKIEWVSLMLRLSSSTSVLPSASAQCNKDDSERNNSRLKSNFRSLLWVIAPVRFFDDCTKLDRFVCVPSIGNAILLQKSTSALADDFTLTQETQPISERNASHEAQLHQWDESFILRVTIPEVVFSDRNDNLDHRLMPL